MEFSFPMILTAEIPHLFKLSRLDHFLIIGFILHRITNLSQTRGGCSNAKQGSWNWTDPLYGRTRPFPNTQTDHSFTQQMEPAVTAWVGQVREEQTSGSETLLTPASE